MDTMSNAMRNTSLAKRLRGGSLEKLRHALMDPNESEPFSDSELILLIAMRVDGADWQSQPIRVDGATECDPTDHRYAAHVRGQADYMMQRRLDEGLTIDSILDAGPSIEVRLLGVAHVMGARMRNVDLRYGTGKESDVDHGGVLINTMFVDMQNSVVYVSDEGFATAFSTTPLPMDYLPMGHISEVTSMNLGPEFKLVTDDIDSTVEAELIRYMMVLNATPEELELL